MKKLVQHHVANKSLSGDSHLGSLTSEPASSYSKCPAQGLTHNRLGYVSRSQELNAAETVTITSVKGSLWGKWLNKLKIWAPEPQSVESQTSTLNLPRPGFPSLRNGDNIVANLKSTIRGQAWKARLN